MSKLNLDTAELVSTLKTAPLNGAPSSADYNDSWRKILADVSLLATKINDELLPLVNVMDSAASTVGIEGRTVYGDSSDTNPLFYNKLQGRPMTLAESLRVLNSLVTNTTSSVADLTNRVNSLDSKVRLSNQTDVSIALQGFSDTLSRLAAQVQAMQQSESTLTPVQKVRITTGPIAANGTASITVNWPVQFPNDTYVVTSMIEDSTQYLQIINFAYNPGGFGIFVRVHNTDTVSSHTGYIHAVGYQVS